MRSTLSLLWMLSWPVAASGAILSITPTVTGTYQYSYSVTADGPGESLFFLTLTGQNLGLVPNSGVGPAGWSVIELVNEISFTSNDPLFDVAHGSTGIFEFQSSQPPGLIQLEGTFADSSLAVSSTFNTAVLGPTEVPEPGTLSLLALAVGLFWCARRQRVLGQMLLLLLPLGLWAAPTARVRINGAPAGFDDVTVRAGRLVSFDASASTGSAPLAYSWQQLGGPSTLRWVSRTGAVASALGAVMGEYRIQVTVSDASGSSSATLTFGAVPTDDQGVLASSDAAFNFLFHPLMRYGASPWPWLDERHRALADSLGQKTLHDPKWNGADWMNALAGTVSVTYGSTTVTGVGTRFQEDFCGGVGQTVPPLYREIVIWYRDGAQTGRRAYAVGRCDSQTTLTLGNWDANTNTIAVARPYLTTPGTASGLSYSYMFCGECWINGSNNVNYYDVVLGFYSLYYRSGRTVYRDYARLLASKWWNQPNFDQARTFFIGDDRGPRIMPPRSVALTGLMWWAHETGQAAVWPRLYGVLDGYSASILTPGLLWELREQTYQLGFLALASRLAPDAGRRASYLAAVQSAITNKWLPQQTAAGTWQIRTFGVSTWNDAPGRANVVNGSDLVTGVGTNWTQSAFNDTYFWVAHEPNGTVGDTASYYQPTVLSPTSLRLPRPYEGATATGRYWTAANLPGWGTQPFIHGLAGRLLDLAYRATGDAALRQAIIRAGEWLLSAGVQPTVKGLYYGRYYPPCEPPGLNVRWCSYDPSQVDSVAYARFLTAPIFGLLSASYRYGKSPSMLAAVDSLAGASVGRFGGPGADGNWFRQLDETYPADRPPYFDERFKEFGEVFGIGHMPSWPAARLGSN